jgi:hypothetical protein
MELAQSSASTSREASSTAAIVSSRRRLAWRIIAGAHEGPGQKPAPCQSAVIAGAFAQPRAVDRPGRAVQDDAVDRGKLAERRQPDLANVGAQPLQRGRHVFEPGGDLGIGRQIGLVEVTDEADPHSAHAALQPGGIMARWRGAAVGVELVVSRDRGKRQRIVGDRPGQRADVVERERQREYPTP